MSNQKIDLLMMTVMSDYVNGIKPYNFRELKGKVDLVSMMLESAHEIEDNSPEIYQSTSQDALLNEEHPYTLDNSLQTNIDDNSQDNPDDELESTSPNTLVITKQRKTRNVWSKKFLDEIKSEYDTFFKTELYITRQQTHNRFIKVFGTKLSAEDKSCPKNSSVPNWQNKLDDNLKGWFVQPGVCTYVNGIYVYTGSVPVIKASEQKALEI